MAARTHPSPRLRVATALFWVGAGTLHFLVPERYEAIVPPLFDGFQRELVLLSGAAEIAGGLAILPRATRRAARWWLLATLVAVFPANVYMALQPERFESVPAGLLWARLPFQAAFGWVTWRGTR